MLMILVLILKFEESKRLSLFALLLATLLAYFFMLTLP